MRIFRFERITIITLTYWILVINLTNPNGYALDLRDTDGIQVTDPIRGKRIGLHWLSGNRVHPGDVGS